MDSILEDDLTPISSHGAASADLKGASPVSTVCSNLPNRPGSPTLSGIVDSPPHDVEPQVDAPPTLASARMFVRRRPGPKPRRLQRPLSPRLLMLVFAGTSSVIWGKLVLGEKHPL